ncbi:hypothetical protein C8F04DRAFT_142495, partial [Mycena alexandri]
PPSFPLIGRSDAGFKNRANCFPCRSPRHRCARRAPRRLGHFASILPTYLPLHRLCRHGTSEILLVAAPIDRRHPGPHGPSTLTYQLAEAAHHAHMRQMRTHLPAFRNVVRRIIIECALDAAEAAAALQRGGERASLGVRRPLDPAMRAARMSLAEVVKHVREEGIWFDDGLEREEEECEGAGGARAGRINIGSVVTARRGATTRRLGRRAPVHSLSLRHFPRNFRTFLVSHGRSDEFTNVKIRIFV